MSRHYVVYLQYTDKNAEGLIVLNRLFKAMNIELTGISVVDNATISGDNTFREWSGWDKGVLSIERGTKIQQDDVLWFVNDTFHLNYGISYLSTFVKKAEKIKLALAQKKLVGIGCTSWLNGELSLEGQTFTKWLRSNLFAMPYSLYRPFKLIDPSYMLDMSRSSTLLKSNTKFISSTLQQQLTEWLTQRWYKAESITPDSKARLLGKLRCILREMFLAIEHKNAIYFIND